MPWFLLSNGERIIGSQGVEFDPTRRDRVKGEMMARGEDIGGNF